MQEISSELVVRASESLIRFWCNVFSHDMTSYRAVHVFQEGKSVGCIKIMALTRFRVDGIYGVKLTQIVMNTKGKKERLKIADLRMTFW